jgi:hypothetical protein
VVGAAEVHLDMFQKPRDRRKPTLQDTCSGITAGRLGGDVPLACLLLDHSSRWLDRLLAGTLADREHKQKWTPGCTLYALHSPVDCSPGRAPRPAPPEVSPPRRTRGDEIDKGSYFCGDLLDYQPWASQE